MKQNNVRIRQVNLFYKHRWRNHIEKEYDIFIDKVEKYLIEYRGYDAKAERIKKPKNAKRSRE